MLRSLDKRKAILFLIYHAFFILALCSFIFPQYVVEYIAREITEVQPTFFGFKYWESPPIETQLSLYVYNVTNVESFLRHKCKPVLVEVGPYRYKFVSKKKNVLWNQNTGTVQYQLSEDYTYMGDTSTTNENQYVIIPNPIFFGMLSVSDRKNKVEQLGIRFLLELFPEHLFIKKKVGDVFFKGYYDPFLDLAQRVTGDNSYRDGIVSFLKEANGTDDRQYTVNSGIKDRSDIYEILEFNNSRYFNHWKSSHCDRVRGTDGAFYPFSITREEPISIFKPRFCRPLKFGYTKDVDVKGIKGYRFDLPFSTLASGTSNPENKCYCLGTCLDSGLIDVSPCQKNVSIAISLPHLKWVEKKHVKRIIDTTPPRKYEAYVELCPITGTALTINISTQVNFLFKEVKGLILNETFLPGLVFPVFWMKLEAQIPDDIAYLVWTILTIPVIVSYVLGSVIIVAMILKLFWIWRKNSTGFLYQNQMTEDSEKLGNVQSIFSGNSDTDSCRSNRSTFRKFLSFRLPLRLRKMEISRLKQLYKSEKKLEISTLS